MTINSLFSNVERYIDASGDCWLWTGPKYRKWKDKWYGVKTYRKEGRVTSKAAHRWVYEQLVGPVSATDLDHLCRNTLCVNPDHLDPVDHMTNLLRSHAIRAYWNRDHQ